MQSKFCFLLSAVLIAFCTACNGPHLSEDSVLLKNVSIVNPLDGTITEAQTILIENGIVTRIIPAGSLAYAAHFEEDATGLFAVPGFAEINFDFIPQKEASALGQELTRLLAAGVTTLVVNSKNVNPALSGLKQKIDNGDLPGPDILIAASVIPEKDASSDQKSYALPAEPDEIASLAENLKKTGTDIIFITNNPEYENQATMLKSEAEAAGMAVSYEKPSGFSLSEAEKSSGNPSEVLQSIFLSYSHYPGIEAKSKAVSEGEPANIAVLSGNPAENLQFLDSVKFIVHNGRLFTADSLRSDQSAGF